MDSKGIIKDYIGAPKWRTIVTWVLFALMVAAIILGATAAGNDKKSEALPFHPLDSKTGSYVYLDVIELSDWLYNNDGSIYYTAGDAEGYFYILRLKDSQALAMSAQQDYWERESDEETPPEPYRIYGMAQSASKNIKESIASSWDITESEYESYFGTLFLNATTSPASESSAIWYLVALFAFIFWMTFFMLGIGTASTAKRCLKRLESLGELDTAAEELSAPDNTFLANDHVRLGQSYIFCRGSGAVVRYSDILWAYKKVVRYNLVAGNEFIVAKTVASKDISLVNLGRRTGADELFIRDRSRINEKNPDALLGYTAENLKVYRERAKAIKNGTAQF